MNNADLMTEEFPLTLPNGTMIRVQKLSVIGERKIYQELSRKLLESYGPGGYFANAKSSLDFLQENKMHAAYAQAVEVLARMTAAKTLPDAAAVDDFRQTPDGVACELFLRTRAAHPELAEVVIRTQLNAVTAWQVCTALWEGLATDHKRRSPDPDGVSAQEG